MMNYSTQNNASKSKVKLGRISYVNVAPIYYRLDRNIKPEWCDIVSSPPAALNSMLAKGEIDISPVSSAAYARHQDDWLLLPDLSISCLGKVMSVILVSKLQFEKLDNRKVILTDDSASAAKLIKLLFLKNNIRPVFESVTIHNPSDIDQDADAALVIGDTALNWEWQTMYAHVIDLGEMWQTLTGLPFVFSVLAVRKKFAEKRPDAVSAVIDLLLLSKEEGLKNIEKIIIDTSNKLGLNKDICKQYFNGLSYALDSSQLKGLNTFFEYLRMEKILSDQVKLSFF
ncbi:MAG: menaquinone biosynthesis protein [Desulfosarcina sp.]|nr:menaquinone biosynthesis protein [Desulfobacterales bacterium]